MKKLITLCVALFLFGCDKYSEIIPAEQSTIHHTSGNVTIGLSLARFNSVIRVRASILNETNVPVTVVADQFLLFSEEFSLKQNFRFPDMEKDQFVCQPGHNTEITGEIPLNDIKDKKFDVNDLSDIDVRIVTKLNIGGTLHTVEFPRGGQKGLSIK